MELVYSSKLKTENKNMNRRILILTGLAVFAGLLTVIKYYKFSSFLYPSGKLVSTNKSILSGYSSGSISIN